MKLFVTDIDETLSVGETVSGEVKEACGRLRKAGWDIMIATGRTFGTAKRHIEAAGATGPSILYDGGRMMSADGRDLHVHATLLDPARTQAVLEYVWDLPLELQITGDEVIHCRAKDRETTRFYRAAGVAVHHVTRPVTEGPVYRIGLWISSGDLPFVEKHLKDAFPDAGITAGGAEFLGVMPEGVSKGSALADFVRLLPRRPEITVAAGDYKNDLTMLRFADIAAVPAGAPEDLLAAADIIIPPASEDGICRLVDHILSPAWEQKQNTSRSLRLC